VSYVLSGKRPVSQKMRERVMLAIEELDYRPHGPARALASGASHTIALFMPSPQWPVLPIHQTFVAGATQATSASDYALLLSTAATDPETVAQIVSGGRADGVILMETLFDDRRVERLQHDGHPFVLIGRTGDNTGISYVDMDFGAAVETALAHLARLGHRCVALLNFPPDLLDAGLTAALIARERFEQRAHELGIRGIDLPCSHEPHEAFEVAARLLRSEPECTAALTTGWQFTGLLGALRAADKRVPDDFSVMGVIAAQFAEMLTPSLTGIEWPAFQAGRMAADLLIEQLTTRDAPPRQILVPAELVVRESTGPAPRTRTSGSRAGSRRPAAAI
jgi:DNA-binding LacI/PurR family transcriptional regulator